MYLNQLWNFDCLCTILVPLVREALSSIYLFSAKVLFYKINFLKIEIVQIFLIIWIINIIILLEINKWFIYMFLFKEKCHLYYPKYVLLVSDEYNLSLHFIFQTLCQKCSFKNVIFSIFICKFLQPYNPLHCITFHVTLIKDSLTYFFFFFWLSDIYNDDMFKSHTKKAKSTFKIKLVFFPLVMHFLSFFPITWKWMQILKRNFVAG